MKLNSASTKEKILSLIKENGMLSVTEMAKELLITEMAVRRHIQVLETDGFLKSVLKKNLTGRPKKVYQISEMGESFFPQQYKQIGMDLLQEINRIDPLIINKAIQSRQERLVSRLQNRFDGKSFKGKINELVKIQSELGFMAEEIDATGEIAEIKQSNCPYLDIAKDFPEICKNEHQLFEELLHTKNIRKISSMSKGDHYCHYVIQKN